ncbi:MAG: hypothetical protein J6N49_03630 [Alphaproteobacteria bacterium]|nr:hypothetical protein [Alphaproteobacteria bacterium]
MIKKIFHFICFVAAGLGWSALLIFIYKIGFAYFYHLDILSAKTYKTFSIFWNSGGVLKSKDLLLIFLLFLYVPLCFFGWYRFYYFKFMTLITKPLNWLVNLGSDKYQVKDVNIKNLKVEEKKTIEQIVQERLDQEKKKNEKVSSDDAGDFRKKIIEKINEGKK